MTNLINQILLEQNIPNSSSINRLNCFNKLAKEQKIPSINDIRPIATTSNIIKILEFIIKDDFTLLNNSFKSNLNQIGFK